MKDSFAIAVSLLLVCCHAYAADPAVGQFQSSATVAGLVGPDSLSYFENVIDVDEEIEWQVYVPDSYDPASPAGLIVYISPSNSGDIPPAWKSVLAEHNLIWMGANDSGNKIDGGIRITHAILAPMLASKDYRIDKSRIYVSGLSGGGRVASIVAAEYAHLFQGAIYNCGVNFWGRKTPQRISDIQGNRYVFVTGSEDFNRRETRKVYNSYRKAGVENVKLMDIARMGHENPNATDLAEAIAFLDMRGSAAAN